ncbi:MAG: tRNA epoxyqueuosine(34) reductase QueG, partial [Planctomycetota bacterium]|nr:tRNA epoxyqueuosine(34) reductase QueG [Planctomycetota bacterium]
MSPATLTARLKQEAHRLGFELCGICRPVTPGGYSRFRQWLETGYAGQMHYLSRRRQAYEHPRHVLDGVRSILMLGMNYRTAEPAPTRSGAGRISRYAWGSDYHDLIRERLNLLADQLTSWSTGAVARGVVDTAPLLEREFAELAGLGWIGKNTLLLNRQLGSWFFLAALLTDVELAYDEDRETDHCGTCTACLDACPTDAFVQPYVLDARRCISYLTIELKEAIPADLRIGLGDWLFGCDVCQDVCPWNSRAPVATEQSFLPGDEADPVELARLFTLDDDQFRARFHDTPLWRPRRRGILRNAAIVLGNQRCGEAMPALIEGLNDREPLVRGACAWALGHLGIPQAVAALNDRLGEEQDEEVRR